MSDLPQLTWPGTTGPPQGPLPVSPPIPPDETSTPPGQLPLEPARPKAPPAELAVTTAAQTPLPSHAGYGRTAVVVAAAKAALGSGMPAPRWWAGQSEEQLYQSGQRVTAYVATPAAVPPSDLGGVTVEQTPYPSHARYGFNPSTVDARGLGAPAARWWAEMDEEAIYLSGLPATPGVPPETPPFVMGPPTPPTPPEPPLPPPYLPPPFWPPSTEPPPLVTVTLTWLGQELTWNGQPMTWRM